VRLLDAPAVAGRALAAVVVLGVPLGVVEAHRVRGEARNQLLREADVVATAVEDRLERNEPVDARRLAPLVRPGHQVTIRVAGRPTISLGRRLEEGGALAERSALAHAALVTARAPAEELNERIRGHWLLIALLSTGGVLAAVLLGVAQGQRLARPLERLAQTSRRLGAGDFSARAGHSAIPEVDAVAAALDAAALQIARLVAREREFSGDVSHQLRTPLTALRLRLEELERLEDPARSRGEATHALAEADRLEQTITDLLAAARSTGARDDDASLDLAELVGSHAETWRPLFERAGRHSEARGPDDELRAAPTAGAVGQALDVLLDNALRHGEGRVVVKVTERAGRPVITITDDGPGPPAGEESAIFERGHSARGQRRGPASRPFPDRIGRGPARAAGRSPARVRATPPAGRGRLGPGPAGPR